jgi:uncharacterized membrane protein
MSDVPVELIVAAFQEENAADEVLKELKAAKRDKLIRIKDAAVLRRDQKDKIHIKDVRDVGGGKGAVFGAVVGTGIALLAGPAGILLSGAAGALVGGLTAKAVDMGLPNDRLKELAESLKPGTSAIVAVIEHRWVEDLERELAAAGAQVVTESLKADIAQQLEAGHEVAYSAVATDDATAIQRTAAGEDVVEVNNIVVTDEGVAADATVITAEGAAKRQVVITDDGIAAAEAVVTEEGAAAVGVISTAEGTVVGAIEASPDEEESDGEEAEAAASTDDTSSDEDQGKSSNA